MNNENSVVCTTHAYACAMGNSKVKYTQNAKHRRVKPRKIMLAETKITQFIYSKTVSKNIKDTDFIVTLYE